MYATRTEIQTAISGLSDSAADALGVRASDVVDGWLGVRAVNDETGRKVTESEVRPWQWERIVRATLGVAKVLHSKPNILSEEKWDRVKGPDFETQGPHRTGASVFGDDVVGLVAGSGLGVYSGRVR